MGVFSKGYLMMCPTADDIWFNIWRIYNDVPCVSLHIDYMTWDMSSKDFDLYSVYNEKTNRKNFIETAKSILNT